MQVASTAPCWARLQSIAGAWLVVSHRKPSRSRRSTAVETGMPALASRSTCADRRAASGV